MSDRADGDWFRGWGRWCVLAVLVFCAAVLAWRRLAGGLTAPLAGPILCFVSFLAVGAALVARAAWRREPPDVVSGKNTLVAAGAFTIALVVLGLAISLPDSSPLGLIIFWGILLAEECWTWRLPSQIAPLLRRWKGFLSGKLRQGGKEAAGNDETPASLDAGAAADADGETEGQLDIPPPDNVLQQIVRSRTPDGSEMLTGWVRVPLAAGQRTATVHLAFCPPLERAPEVEAVQCEGPEARIAVAQSLPSGARLDLKITDPSDEPTAALLQFSAQVGPPPEEPQAIAVAVVRHAGRVLIGERPPGVPLAGLWEFPGGKVRSGETPQEAAARECAEETGLAVRIGQVYPEVVHQYEYGRVRLHFFAAEPVDASRPPVAPFRWVPIGELAQYQFPAANAAVLSRLADEAALR